MIVTVTHESVRRDSMRSTTGEQAGARSLEVEGPVGSPPGEWSGDRECGTRGELEKGMKPKSKAERETKIR
ncbi:unnamed protein product [Dovyalis caffra]|uniref:Uncharacterized protein n=1 Tax=Dovyalis caffra TaxID=77055 RepID=A0AAV1RJB9_9ROSI|nr:unnamed protein product [Dovyalis caffra]